MIRDYDIMEDSSRGMAVWLAMRKNKRARKLMLKLLAKDKEFQTYKKFRENVYVGTACACEGACTTCSCASKA